MPALLMEIIRHKSMCKLHTDKTSSKGLISDLQRDTTKSVLTKSISQRIFSQYGVEGIDKLNTLALL